MAEVTGRVTDSQNNPVRVSVHAVDVEVLDSQVLMGNAWTDASGNYTISYSNWVYGLERNPDIILRVYDYVGRLVYESQEYPDVSDTVFRVDISIPVADLKGWLVTLLTGSPTLLSQGNLLTPLIDNKKAWEELTREVKGAAKSINSVQLLLDAENVFTVFTSMPVVGRPTTGERFEEEIYNANHTRNVPARLVINDFIWTSNWVVNFLKAVEDYFKNKMPHTVEVRRFSMPWNRAMHAKFTIIDGMVVIMNASPLLQEYFDDVTHDVDDPRRGSMSRSKNAIRIPVHDVNCSIQGPAVEHFDDTFFLLWLETGGTGMAVPSYVPPPSITVNTSVQIVRTLPGVTFPAIPNGELGILEAYLRAIGEAEDFIYLENQYITEPLITKALLFALKAKSQLRVIILMNNALDLPLYQQLQTRRIQEFLDDAEKNSVNNRVGLFTLWTHDASSSPQRIIRNYVHSKVGIVDNKWATIGSANLDGLSLYLSQHTSSVYSSASDMLEERAIEVNIVVYNGVDGQPPSTVPDDLRRALWAEHLGINISDNRIQTSPTGLNGEKWLKLWKDTARAKVEGLKKSPPTDSLSRILEWQREADPEEYLKHFDIKPSKDLKIETEVRDFDFTTGDWVS